MDQWLGLCAFMAKGVSLIPGWGTKAPQASGTGPPTHTHTHTHKSEVYGGGISQVFGETGTENHSLI